MKHKLLSFKEFVRSKPSYLDKLQDELDIDPSAMDDMPQWGANLSLGNLSYNGLTYTYNWVKDSKGNISGAMIKPLETQRVYKKDDEGRNIRMPKGQTDSKEMFVPIEKMNQLLNQEVGKNNGSNVGSMGGGLPGGGLGV